MGSKGTARWRSMEPIKPGSLYNCNGRRVLVVAVTPPREVKCRFSGATAWYESDVSYMDPATRELTGDRFENDGGGEPWPFTGIGA